MPNTAELDKIRSGDVKAFEMYSKMLGEHPDNLPKDDDKKLNPIFKVYITENNQDNKNKTE